MAHPTGSVAGPTAPLSLADPVAALAGDWRPEVALPLALWLALYTFGWWRLRTRATTLAPGWRLGAAILATAAIAAALISPLDRWAHERFSAHMVQHLLLLKLAAPALLLANPLPMVLWGLPRPARLWLGGQLSRGRPLRGVWRALTAMPAAWGLSALALWFWHVPVAWEAALSDRLLHDLEHLVFFGSGLLFWWPLLGAAPRLRAPAHPGARLAYLLLGAFQEAALGLLLTVSPWVLYPTYAERLSGLAVSALEDQWWGGVVMWGVGGVIDMVAVLVVLFRVLDRREPLALPVESAEPAANWPRSNR
ncbi:MAG: cytochrome c oxidase assembly protein [Candidatus Rokuibacteriota bacterium]